MRTYRYVAVDINGKQIKDVMNVESPEQLMSEIKGKSLYCVSYEEIPEMETKTGKLKLKSLVVFCRQLGTMLTAGIPVTQALDMIQSKADSKKAKKVFANVYEEVQKGNSLSHAMQLQEGLFPSLLVNMVMAGEAGGTLDISVARMADHFDKEHKLNNKVKGAMTYPIILLVVALAVVLILVTFVLPTITQMFDEKSMPWTTKMLLGFSGFVIHQWWVILLVIVGSIFLIRYLLRMPAFRLWFDKLILFMPIVGKLNQTIYSARCARTFASLYLSGVPALDMLMITGKVLNNKYLEKMFDDVIAGVSRGEFISTAIAQTMAFDPMLSSMIFIGEEAGALGDILSKTADYFDNESDAAIARMVALMEPAMIVVLGVIVAFIVVSIMQPMFAVYDTIGA
ncbi:MAG TPA: type II secretion system F family protein [Erysipelotrichaceae bacterium]|nr:type II secretion system F family protein [Erysipelotrichaceae bacterium]